MEGTPLLHLFLPRLGFTRYVMQRSRPIETLALIQLQLSTFLKNIWLLGQKADSSQRGCFLIREQAEFTSTSNGKYLVELSGVEPLTSCVQGRRSPS